MVQVNLISIEHSAYLPKQQWVGRCHPSWKRGARFLSLGRARKGGSSARPSCGGPGPTIECLAATWLLGGRGRLSLGFWFTGTRSRTQFGLDPEIKREAIFHSAFYESKSALVERNGPSLRARDDSGRWQHLDQHLPHYESLLSHFGDPMRLPEALHLREWIRTWRFYDQFRTDRDAPVRKPQVATRTLVLNHDGRDLAAAWQTILEVGDDEALAACLDDAFPGARVEIRKVQGSFELLFHQPGLLRPLTLAELSDGTLRYLLWIAALLSPRAAGLMVLNEPENSLHPQLLPPLARLLLLASERSQVWVTSHAERLVRTLVDSENCQHVGLVKEQGATRWQDDGLDTTPAWRWLKR